MGQVDLAAALDGLRDRSINYAESAAPTPGRVGNWHVDQPHAVIGQESPGPPTPGGAWEIARHLVREYEFAAPRIIRAVYRRDEPLLGRDMLLEGRFGGLRFYMGVRVTEVIDTDQGGERTWGWAYQTLEGHLEQGKLAYEVVKIMDSGQVELRLRAYSRAAPMHNPIIRMGFRLFGRRIQLRFYAEVARRLHDSVRAIQAGAPAPRPAYRPDGLVVAPSSITAHPLERLALSSHHPGR